MHVNLDHSIIKKQIHSQKLAKDVQDFLKKNNLDAPTQVPSGTSLYLEHCKKNNIKPYSNHMRDTMAYFVEEAHSKKKKPSVIKEECNFPMNRTERLEYNREARQKAMLQGFSSFKGYCSKHQWQNFLIRANGDHYCKLCYSISNKASAERRKAKQ